MRYSIPFTLTKPYEAGTELVVCNYTQGGVVCGGGPMEHDRGTSRPVNCLKFRRR